MKRTGISSVSVIRPSSSDKPMRMSRDHILTSQAGSLPRPDDLIEANRAREAGETTDERRYPGHPASGGG